MNESLWWRRVNKRNGDWIFVSVQQIQFLFIIKVSHSAYPTKCQFYGINYLPYSLCCCYSPLQKTWWFIKNGNLFGILLWKLEKSMWFSRYCYMKSVKSILLDRAEVKKNQKSKRNSNSVLKKSIQSCMYLYVCMHACLCSHDRYTCGSTHAHICLCIWRIEVVFSWHFSGTIYFDI